MVAAGKLLQVILVFADRFLQILVGLEFPQDIRIYQFLLILQQLLNSSDMLEIQLALVLLKDSHNICPERNFLHQAICDN